MKLDRAYVRIVFLREFDLGGKTVHRTGEILEVAEFIAAALVAGKVARFWTPSTAEWAPVTGKSEQIFLF